MQSLVIVESPSKSKTIKKYLGKDYIVEATVGHIKNLPKSKLGVDIENGYEPKFVLIKGKEEVLKKLCELSAKAEKVYIATDPDREGEAIAYDIAKEIEKKNSNILRVLFHEITESGIREAMKNPQNINQNLVDSQRARRVMDRIVGYKISPFLWKTVYHGLSAGRVQSVALRLICEREEQIKNFTPEEYWSITGEFKTEKSESFLARLISKAGESIKIPDEASANSLTEDLKKQLYVIKSITKKIVKRNPPAPFITSTLQQEAASRLGFSAKKTMQLAQELYEGVEIGEDGLVGLITYMRTDSTRLSSDAIEAVREYIFNNYGKEYLPKEPREFKKGKASQDAHEAIRPTTIKYEPRVIKKYLHSKDLFRLYELIWNRFVASQMTPAEFDQITVEISGGDYLFRATGTTPKFRGFLQVYDDIKPEEQSQAESEEPVSKIPANLKENENAQLLDLIPKQHFTKPPARYTESSLVKDLEAYGIGRPSTYAQIVSTIIDRKYVEQRDRKLYALPLGMEVNQLLVKNFPEIFNVKFTAKMEEELDTIASGKRTFLKVMDDFYKPFSHALEKITKKTHEIKKSLQESTDEVCEKCGKPMVIKWGRNGKFKACSGYPECKNTKPIEENKVHEHLNGLKCELCGGEMIVKTSKYGSFLGCSNYPKCENTKPISMEMKCPKCKEGNLVERKTKRGKTFYGCSRYPDCDFASWDKPIDRKCDVCDSDYLIEKYNQKIGRYLQCPKCKAKIEISTEEIAAG